MLKEETNKNVMRLKKKKKNKTKQEKIKNTSIHLNYISNHTFSVIVIFCSYTVSCFLLKGDYGGPLVSQYEDVWYLIGMPSWSRGCADSGYPGVYTRVTYFEDWIMDVIEGNYTGNSFVLQNARQRVVTLASYTTVHKITENTVGFTRKDIWNDYYASN